MSATKENSISDSEEEDEDEDDVEDPNSLKDILEIVKAAGGVEGLEKQIEEKEAAKKEEEDRRVRISSKTRSRLSQLLNRGQSPKPQRNSSSEEDSLTTPTQTPKRTTTARSFP